MEELIKITEEDGRRAVSARELHAFLESKQEFSHWIKARIEKYGFVEGQDYCSFDKIINREIGATKAKEYALSIDMAKELSMVENNERGRKARKYFIECEKIAKEKQQLSLPQTFAEALMLAAKQQEQIEQQQKAIQQSAQEIVALSNTITQMQPKVSYYDQILNSKGTCTITQIAQDYGMSAKAMNKQLEQMRIQRKIAGQWCLYSKYLSEGYVHSKAIDIVHSDGSHGTKYNTEWTIKGRIFLYGELKKQGIIPMIERH